MTATVKSPVDDTVSALGAYLARGGEAELKAAYEVGRLALAEGLGVLDVVALYRQSLHHVLSRVHPSRRTAASLRSTEFLAECLSPFEMTHRGFRETNARLRELNQKLRFQVAEQARDLKTAEAKYKARVEQGPAVTYIESPTSESVVYISPQIESLLEFTQQEWLAEPDLWARQIQPLDLPRVRAALARFREGDERFLSEYRMRTRQGRELWVHHEAARVRDEERQVRYVQGTLHDVTDRKHAEKGGRGNEDLLRKILNQSIDAILIADLRDWNILDANTRALTLFGYSRQELKSLGLSGLFPGQDAGIRGFVRQVVDHGGWTSEGLTLRARDGGESPAEISASITDIRGVPCLLSMVRDITERKRVERQKNDFISIVSHELRTPLTSVRGSLGLIGGGVCGPIPAKAYPLLDAATQNCDRLAKLIDDMLDIEKIESGNATFEIRPTDLREAVEQAIATNRPYAEGFQVVLVLETDLHEACVRADPDRTIQVLTNLISNAVKFSPPGDGVVLSLYRAEAGFRVSVTDHGPGIPEEFRERVFQKFSQARASSERNKRGTGLGLSICKAIVEKLGGQIGFETASGRGTTFFFELPTCAKEAE